MSHDVLLIMREDRKVFMCAVEADAQGFAHKWCYTNRAPVQWLNHFGQIHLTRPIVSDIFFARRGDEGEWIWSPWIKDSDLLPYELALAFLPTIPVL